MIVLSRKIGESVVIGELPNQVEVFVSSVKGDQVRLAIKAPKSIKVDRCEVREMKEQAEAGL